MIPFNKPYFSGKETEYILEAVRSQKISGDGMFTKKCQQFFEERFGFKKVLLTTSCTDALELAALLLDIREGDEIIMPSYTFVSTANAFVLRGAKIVFADSEKTHPNMDVSEIEKLITPRTKVLVPVHYAGVACDMDAIKKLAAKYGLYIVEDAAQAIDSKYKNQYLGTFGHLAAFSFHETKNIICGEGGMLVINDERFFKRAEILREKGTNRSQFFRGEVDKYSWVDLGSSFLPSDILAAYLYAQLENLESIQKKRTGIWNTYYEGLKDLDLKNKIKLPVIPDYATQNGHLFYFSCAGLAERDRLLQFLKQKGITAVFHYLSLHQSVYYRPFSDGSNLPNCDGYTDTLVRLPLFYELTPGEQEFIIQTLHEFYA